MSTTTTMMMSMGDARCARRRRRDASRVVVVARSEPWAVSCARVFQWDDVLASVSTTTTDDDDDDDDDAEEATTTSAEAMHASSSSSSSSSTSPTLMRGTTGRFIVIDGANLAWGLAQKMKSRFTSKTRVPMSAAVLAALDYEPWRASGFTTHAFIPREYVVGYVNSVCDGGGLSTVNAELVEYLGKGVWANRRLMDQVDAGRLTLVSRDGTDGRGLRKADDLTILTRAKEADAWICSNDKFRDHRRERGIGFSSGKALKEFARLRRFDHNFLIPFEDDVINATVEASGWTPRVGASFVENYDGPHRRVVPEREPDAPTPYHAMPQRVLPVYFEPLPTDSMKTARKTYLERQGWSVSRITA